MKAGWYQLKLKSHYLDSAGHPLCNKHVVSVEGAIPVVVTSYLRGEVCHCCWLRATADVPKPKGTRTKLRSQRECCICGDLFPKLGDRQTCGKELCKEQNLLRGRSTWQHTMKADKSPWTRR